jgi:alkanesulfonate monooxygenase SsuD/methylene tetrahydromethanopterin reductase-like flavin-dependent oxidoreductase (luciferase family)
MSVGSAATVKAKLDALVESTKADEVMVTTMLHGHEARKRSYELLAQALGLKTK